LENKKNLGRVHFVWLGGDDQQFIFLFGLIDRVGEKLLPYFPAYKAQLFSPETALSKAQNRFLPMCSNFASQVEARGAAWKKCVAVLLNSIRFHTF
jgi:hypothetical protein